MSSQAGMNSKREKIRLLMVEPFISVGGEEKIVLNLLKNLDRSSFDIEILCNPDGPLLPEIEKLNLPLHVIAMQSKSDWQTIPRIVKIITDGHYDLINGHNSFAGLFVRIANLFAGRTKIIWTDHLLPHQHHDSTMKSKLWGGIYTLPFSLLDCVTDRVVYVSESALQNRQQYPHISKRKMVCIPNGIELEIPVPQKFRNNFRNQLSIGDDTFLIGMVTLLKRQKGVDILLKALAEIKRKRDKVKCVVVGDGPDSAEIKRLAAAANFGSDLIFTGQIENVAEILPAFDLAVLPSRFEGLSVTLLEYMAAGLPIIASDIPNNREVLDHGQAGVLFPPENHNALANAALNLIENSAASREFAENARRRYLEHYSVHSMVSQYENLFRQLVSA
ncbi:MAG: glycosyltransferase [FCB group bacterium]|nr:glycosyltransferase [FCB group bacterium]